MTTGLDHCRLLLALCAVALPAAARGGPGGRRPPGPSVVVPTKEPGIAWFGTWKAARAEAVRTNRPILLLSAAPHCRNVPGVW